MGLSIALGFIALNTLGSIQFTPPTYMISNQYEQVVVTGEAEIVEKKKCTAVHTNRDNFETSLLKQYMDYAYRLGGFDFVLLLNAEKGDWNIVGKAKGTEDSRGFCQINRRRYASIVDDARFASDRRRQIEQCYRLWKGGTRFYGWEQRHVRGVYIKEVCD